MKRGNAVALRRAGADDVAAALEICDDGRRYQRELGFFQWRDGYPSREVIEADIAAEKGYLILLDGCVAGYCVIDPEGDAEYDSIPSLWLSSRPYAAVHRLVLARRFRGQHLSRTVFEAIFERIAALGIYSVKVDTGLDNTPMQKLLESLAFTRPGTHTFSWGPRIAYEKSLDS